jgi:uncharacterized damage-inducible protein DinB
MHWADAKTWTAVLASERPRNDEGIRGTLYHLHLVQWAFLRVWRGAWREGADPTFADAPALMQWAKTYYPDAMTYLGLQSDTTMAQRLDLPWAEPLTQQLGQAPQPSTVGETVLQVAMHSQHHRGQVNRQLRALGAEPPTVDFIVWVWLGRPAPEWP